MKNYLQEVVAEAICNILNRYPYDVIRSSAFQPVIMIIRNTFIRQYQEHPDNAESTWQDIASYKSHFLWSPRAFRAYSSAIQEGIPDAEIAHSKNELLHFEHIVPNHVILNRILELKNGANDQVGIEKVKDILDESAIVILSKEEAQMLDGNPMKTYTVEGVAKKGCGLRSKGTKAERLAALGIEKLYSFAELQDHAIQ